MTSPQTEPTPWSNLDEDGTDLTVDAFITTLISQVGNALRRRITVPYAEEFGLSVSEWRLLSLVAHAGPAGLSFADLVLKSSSDKALVSRTLKLLEGRDLVELSAAGSTPRKKVHCTVTAAGEALHRQAIPIARARQAAVIRSIPQDQRDAMYRALVHLRAQCDIHDPSGQASSNDDVRGLDI